MTNQVAKKRKRSYADTARDWALAALPGPRLSDWQDLADWHSRAGPLLPQFRKKRMLSSQYITKGTIGRKFRAGRRKKKSNAFTKYGYIVNHELRGVITDSACAYIGHCTTPDTLTMRAVVNAIMRKLMLMGGRHIQNPGETFAWSGTNIGQLKYWYVTSMEASEASNTVDWVSTETLDDFAAKWLADMFTQFLNQEDPTILKVQFDFWDNDVANGKGSVVQLIGSQLAVHIQSTSKLTVQNRTLASSAVGADETNRNDITNNPLSGYHYKSYGNGPRLTLKDDVVTQESLVANPRGLITVATAGLSADQFAVYKRPPFPKNLNGVKTAAKVVLNPGVCRKSIISSYNKLMLNTLLKKLVSRWSIGDTFAKIKFHLGNSALLSLQKEVDTGVDEPSITVGYEIERTMRVRVTHTPPNFLPETVDWS